MSINAQDDVNAAASLKEATFWHRCPDKDNLGDGLLDCDCTRDGKPWFDWFGWGDDGKKTCTVVVTQTVGETVPGIPQPTTPGCDQNGHCTVTVTQTVSNGGTPGISVTTTTTQPGQPFPTQTQPGFTQPTQTFSIPTTTIGQPGFPTQTSSLFSSVISSASSSLSSSFSSIESQASSQISSVYSHASSELSSLTSKLSTATGSDRSSITSEIGSLTSSAASMASSINSAARSSIFRTGAAAPLQTAGVAMGALFGGAAVLANI